MAGFAKVIPAVDRDSKYLEARGWAELDAAARVGERLFADPMPGGPNQGYTTLEVALIVQRGRDAEEARELYRTVYATALETLRSYGGDVSGEALANLHFRAHEEARTASRVFLKAMLAGEL